MSVKRRCSPCPSFHDGNGTDGKRRGARPAVPFFFSPAGGETISVSWTSISQRAFASSIRNLVCQSAPAMSA
jgi:hypothetical protein